jgi:hypothetical protein
MWFIGVKNLLPGVTDWLRQGDIGTQQAAWQYFRNSPILQWPITAIPKYGDGWDTVVPGAVGNALTAIPAKYLTRWFPGEFQYFGLWIVLSFALQAVIGNRILREFNLSVGQRILGSFLLVLSPVFLFRIGMSHPDLASHWLLLLSILFFLVERRSWPWLLLIVVSLCVALYLFAMVVGVWLAWLVQRNIVDQLYQRETPAWVEMVRKSFLGLVTMVIVLWLLGFFSFAGSTKGTGFFRLNVLALVNPDFSSSDSYSALGGQIPYFAKRQLFAEEGEGFAYLGTLSILALPLLGWMLIRHRTRILRHFAPLVAIVGVFAILAVSNQVVIGRSEFSYWMPDVIIELRQMFRATPRFIWPLSYLLIIGGWVALSRFSNLLKPRIGTPLLLLALILHGLDSAPGIAWAHERVSASATPMNALSSPQWDSVFAKRTSIALVPTIDLQIDSEDVDVQAWIDSGRWIDILNFSSVRDITVNFAYQGRPRGDLAERITELTRRELSGGVLQPGVVYFFSTESEWRRTTSTLDPSIKSLVIDGYHIILGPEVFSDSKQ